MEVSKEQPDDGSRGGTMGAHYEADAICRPGKAAMISIQHFARQSIATVGDSGLSWVAGGNVKGQRVFYFSA